MRFGSASRFCCLEPVFLLLRQNAAHFGFAIFDYITADIESHAVDGASELERRGIEGRDWRTGVRADGNAAGQPQAERGRVRELRLPDQFTVHIELRTSGRAFAVSDVGRAGDLKLEAQFVVPRLAVTGEYKTIFGAAAMRHYASTSQIWNYLGTRESTLGFRGGDICLPIARKGNAGLLPHAAGIIMIIGLTKLYGEALRCARMIIAQGKRIARTRSGCKQKM